MRWKNEKEWKCSEVMWEEKNEKKMEVGGRAVFLPSTSIHLQTRHRSHPGCKTRKNERNLYRPSNILVISIALQWSRAELQSHLQVSLHPLPCYSICVPHQGNYLSLD